MLLQGKRIFVFEDDAFNLAIITVPLKREGATVLFDRWGINAREVLMDALPLDLIALDLMYPYGVTGYQIFDEIRSTPELASIPVVAVTAADPDTEMPIAREKGFSGFLAKPIPTNFTQFIAALINGESVWEAD